MSVMKWMMIREAEDEWDKEGIFTECQGLMLKIKDVKCLLKKYDENFSGTDFRDMILLV